MTQRTYVLVIFFIGIILTIVGYYEGQESPAPKVIYKYVDSTIEEAQKGGQQSVFNTHIQMFSDPPILT